MILKKPEKDDVDALSGITVREILEIFRDDDFTVLAGEAGVDKKVTSISVLEIPNPSVSWLMGGELILSTVQVFNEASKASDILEDLHSRDVAALGLHQGVVGGEVAQAVLDKAERFGFPVFSIPGKFPYSLIFTNVYERIFNEQAERLLKSKEISNALTQTIFARESIDSIALTLANLLKKPVVILDENYQILAKNAYGDLGPAFLDCIAAGHMDGYFQQLKAGILENLRNPSLIDMTITGNGYVATLYRAFYGGECVGSIMILGAVSPNVYERQVDLMGLSHSATTLAMIHMKERAVRDAEERMRGDLYYELIFESVISEELLSVRTEKLGIPMHGGHCAIVAAISDLGQNGEDPLQDSSKAALGHIARRACESHLNKFAILPKGEGLLAVVHFGESKKPTSRTERVSAICKSIIAQADVTMKNVKIDIGVGEIQSSLLQLPKSYRQALNAITLGKRVATTTRIHVYGEMGIYSLFNVDSMEEFRSGCRKELEKLSSTAKNPQVFFETLEAYFDSGERVGIAAKTLNIHVNTVKYRIERIKDAFGSKFFDDGKEKLRVYILLKLRKLL